MQKNVIPNPNALTLFIENVRKAGLSAYFYYVRVRGLFVDELELGETVVNRVARALDAVRTCFTRFFFVVIMVIFFVVIVFLMVQRYAPFPDSASFFPTFCIRYSDRPRISRQVSGAPSKLVASDSIYFTRNESFLLHFVYKINRLNVYIMRMSPFSPEKHPPKINCPSRKQ